MIETIEKVSFHIPIDLVIDILSRLPSKSLLRFKSICKTWYAIIQNPNFIEKHHQFKSTVNHVLVNINNKLYINDDDGCYKPIDFGSKLLREKVFCGLLGVCNGILCIYVLDCCNRNNRRDYIFIGNPMTREFRQIPPCESILRIEYGSLFGFSSFSNDHKLVLLAYYHGVFIAGVYSTSTDSWEKTDVKMVGLVETWFDDIFYGAGMKLPVVLNGLFHWIGFSSYEAGIMSLDIHKKLFYVIKIPTDVFDPHFSSLLFEFEEKLTLLTYKQDRKLNFWVLNEDGITWMLKLRIDDFPNVAVPKNLWESGLQVMGFTKTGELLVNDGFYKDTKLFSYDLRTRETKLIPTSIDYYRLNNYYYFYNESLRLVYPRNVVVEDDQNLPKTGDN